MLGPSGPLDNGTTRSCLRRLRKVLTAGAVGSPARALNKGRRTSSRRTARYRSSAR